MENVLIFGTGCAGLTAALYTARANLAPLVLEGLLPGGQLTTTTMVENFPGFPDGILGFDLIQNMKKQAEKFGARYKFGAAEKVEKNGKFFDVTVDGETLSAKTIIVASGADPRYLGLENEKKLIGHGVTSCATCDGAFYKDCEVAVIGGGDSAAEESSFLTRFATKVYLIHRRDQLRASKIMQNRVFENDKIEPIWDTVVTDVLDDGAGKVAGLQLQNVKNNEEKRLDVAAMFVAIGHVPNTQIFGDLLELDEEGYLLTQNGRSFTNVPGIFAAGDVHDKIYRQAVTAAGRGCAAAIDAEKYLESLTDE